MSRKGTEIELSKFRRSRSDPHWDRPKNSRDHGAHVNDEPAYTVHKKLFSKNTYGDSKRHAFKQKILKTANAHPRATIYGGRAVVGVAAVGAVGGAGAYVYRRHERKSDKNSYVKTMSGAKVDKSFASEKELKDLRHHKRQMDAGNLVGIPATFIGLAGVYGSSFARTTKTHDRASITGLSGLAVGGGGLGYAGHHQQKRMAIERRLLIRQRQARKAERAAANSGAVVVHANLGHNAHTTTSDFYYRRQAGKQVRVHKGKRGKKH